MIKGEILEAVAFHSAQTTEYLRRHEARRADNGGRLPVERIYEFINDDIADGVIVPGQVLPYVAGNKIAGWFVYFPGLFQPPRDAPPG